MLYYWLFATTFKHENPYFLPPSRPSFLFFLLLQRCKLNYTKMFYSCCSTAYCFFHPLWAIITTTEIFTFFSPVFVLLFFFILFNVQTWLFETVLIMLYKRLFSVALEQEYLKKTFFFLFFFFCFFTRVNWIISNCFDRVVQVIVYCRLGAEVVPRYFQKHPATNIFAYRSVPETPSQNWMARAPRHS